MVWKSDSKKIKEMDNGILVEDIDVCEWWVKLWRKKKESDGEVEGQTELFSVNIERRSKRVNMIDKCERRE